MTENSLEDSYRRAVESLGALAEGEASRERRAVLEEGLREIGRVLADESAALDLRFRALFSLKHLGLKAKGVAEGGAAAGELVGLTVAEISRAFSSSSALLKHELAYCLGQMKDGAAIPVLGSLLGDLAQEPMVRHEAGRAKANAFAVL